MEPSKDRRRGCREFRGRGVSRRDALRAGAVAMAGLGLPDLYRNRAVAGGSNGFGRAKSCLLIFMWGGPSQLDTWDPKPDAPAEIRGSFGTIATRTPGVRISEHFPMLATRTDKLAIVRSMSHDDFTHLSTAHRVVTGHLAPTPYSDAAGPSPNDWPHLGSLVARVRPRRGALPQAVTMPWTVAHPAAPGGKAPGQHGGWLGKAYDPFRVDGDPNADDFRVEGLGLPDGITADRLGGRRALRRGSTTPTGSPGPGPPPGTATATGRSTRSARPRPRAHFRVDCEDPRLRDRYGRNIHGQCLLLARRLIESGVPLVTVNWHDDHMNFWDTHGDNFNQLKDRLMPPADRGLAALLDDLDSRGMLDETLVVWVGEFGRKPHITRANAGREHWPHCYTRGPGRRGDPRRRGPRRLRPMGRLSRPRPRWARRHRRHHPARTRHRSGDRDPRPRRPAAPDQ